MKKTMLLALIAMMMMACANDKEESVRLSKEITFSVDGDFLSPIFRTPTTRASLVADGVEMTDLWVLDYMDGVLVQSMHQVKTDADWGTPKLSLAYGSHHVYFVAARGDNPTLDESGHTITWEKPKDTFWLDEAVNVTQTTTSTRSVTLNRVATKLKVTVKDEVPEACAQITIKPSTWYCGFDYLNGLAVGATNETRVITVPASYAGTTGSLSASIFGLSDTDEWTTDILLQSLTDDGTVLGQATITNAPFKRNRATEYSGNLFGSGGGMDVNLNDTWEQAFTAEW